MSNLKKWIGKVGEIQDIDWDFPDARREKTTYMTHGAHGYTSKYIPQIPYNLIKKYSKKGDLILDNFVGSGTTLVEACILGRNSIGVDLSQYPCLISSVKTAKLTKPDLTELDIIIQKITNYIKAFRENNPEEYDYASLKLDTHLEEMHFISRLYPPPNLKQLLIIKNNFENITY